jgi:hypothetical protein
MRLLSSDTRTDEVSLILTKSELESLEGAARSLRLSENGTHRHVNDDQYQNEIVLVLADPRTRAGFNDLVNALVDDSLS